MDSPGLVCCNHYSVREISWPSAEHYFFYIHYITYFTSANKSLKSNFTPLYIEKNIIVGTVSLRREEKEMNSIMGSKSIHYFGIIRKKEMNTK